MVFADNILDIRDHFFKLIFMEILYLIHVWTLGSLYELSKSSLCMW